MTATAYQPRHTGALHTPRRRTKPPLTGQFGRLTIETFLGATRDGQMIYGCLCACGTRITAARRHVVSGRTQSCGCLQSERAVESNSARRLAPGEACMNALLHVYKRGAARRGLSFEISRDEFVEITSRPCHYCGIPPMQVARQRGAFGEYRYNGIDRFDNSVGYTSANCVPCCKVCNANKRAMTHAEFIGWLKRAHDHYFRFF